LDEPTDMTETDPMLAALANNGGDTLTHALQTGSPAIGAGNTAACLAAPISGVDQRGFLRDTTACDIGAYEYGLTFAIGLDGDGVGNVDGKGIDCGDGGLTCTIKHEHGDSFPLEATAAAGSVFAGWSGDLSGTTNPVTVTINTPLHITATFNLIRHDLTVAKAGTGAGLVTSDPAGITCGGTCSADFVEGAMVELTAAPSAGSTFVGWTGAVVSSDAVITVTMDEAKSVTATFDLLPGNFLLTVSKAGTGSGTVTSDPVGIDCGDTCAAGFSEDTVVTLTAVASAGSTFAGWSGAVTSNSPAIEVTMDAAKNITATFNDDNAPPAGYAIFLPLISR
jgi:trimeric autotransporter adhesin